MTANVPSSRTLPLEMWNEILFHLGSSDTVTLDNCREVCKEWNELIKRSLWKPNKDWGIITKRMIEKKWSQNPEWLPSEDKILYIKNLENRGVIPSGVFDSLARKIKPKLYESPSLNVLTCAVNLAHNGYLFDVMGLWLGDQEAEEGMMLEGEDLTTVPAVDLSTIPAEHLASLVSTLTGYFSIEKIRGCDLVAMMDSLKTPMVVIYCQSLNTEETGALVRAMESRVEKLWLGWKVELDIEVLKGYSGQGKCMWIKCYDDTAARYTDQLESWSRDTNRHWQMIWDESYLSLRRDP